MSYYSYLNFEYFCYSIQELSIDHKEIKIDLNLNKTIEDIKEKIASEIQIPSDKIQFEHAPNVELKDLKSHYNFQLSINNLNKDLNIQLPNGKMTQIKNCYKKNLKGIIEFLESEGFYYTQEFIKNNFHLYLAGKEIRDEKFPFLSANRLDSLCIKSSGPVIKEEHGKFQFYISETDFACDVTKLIERAYPNSKASFLGMDGLYPSPLKSTEQYVIRVETKVKFKDTITISDYCEEIFVDLYDTVLKARELLYKKLNTSSYNYRYKPSFEQDNLFILDKDWNPITDLNKKLSDIKSLDEIFLYKIDTSKKISPQPSTDISPPKSTANPLIVSKPPESMSKDSINPTPTEKKTEPVKPAVAEAYDKKVPSDSLIITIVCDKSSERKFLPIKKSFKLKSTIKDVKDYIVLKNNLKKNNKVTIKYKRDDAFVGTFASLTIDEIKDKIQEKIKDKIENVLYYEIKSKGKDESESESKSDYSDDESIPKSAAKKKSDEIEERNEKSKKSSSESEENNNDEDKNPRLKKASNNRSKEIDEEPGKIKTVNRPRRSASSCKPKIKKEPQSPASPKNPTHASESEFFSFIFDEKTRNIRLDINSPFEDNIETVKSKFCIDPSDQVEFRFTDAAGDTTRIRDTSTKMKKFIKGKIYVYKQTGKETTKNNKNDKKNKKSPPSDEDDLEDEIPSVNKPVIRFGKKKSPKWKDEDDSDDETRAKPSLIRKKGPVKPKKVGSNEDDSDDEEPKKAAKKKTAKGPAKSKKVDSDEDDSDNETRAKPSLRRKKGSAKSKEAGSDEDDSEDETRAKTSNRRKKGSAKSAKADSDDSDSEEPKKAAKKKTAKNPIKTKKFDSDSDDEDDDKGGKKKSAKKKPAKSISDDDDDDESSKKKPSKSKSKKASKNDDDDKKSAKKSKSKKIKYFYQVYDEDEIKEAELDSDATVKTLKKFIAEEQEIDDIDRLKIIFASKELLDDILLEPMEIGDTTIFVYISQIGNIFLETAKANRIKIDD